MSKSNNKCSENNRCQECKAWLEEKLLECKEWEIKRKESYRNFELRFCPNQISRNDDEMPDLPKYSETGGYNLGVCFKCGEKWEQSNNHGDINPVSHICNKKDQPIERERERERTNSTIFQTT